jgi:hypothetical protein
MATITMVASVNYSTLGAVNNDIINLNGYTLTIATQPAETGISIITPAKAGAVVISGGYDLSTWSMTAGTKNGAMITTIPANCVVGELVGGSANNAYGCENNNGTITICTGGAGSSSHGCRYNNTTITTCTGGSVSYAYGCQYNNGTITTCTGGHAQFAGGCNTNNTTITTCTGGSASGAQGCNTNNGTITTCTGGTLGGAQGCNTNYGTITTCTGGLVNDTVGCMYNRGMITEAVGGVGSAAANFWNPNFSAYGVHTNYSWILNLTDDLSQAVNVWSGASTIFVMGPGINGEIKAPVETIYSLGTMNAGATLPVGATVVTMSEGAGGGLIKIGQGGGYNG